MIQRIQTIWLLLAGICAALTYKFSFYTGQLISNETKTGIDKLDASEGLLLIVSTAVLTVACFIIIFLYKTRKQQQWYTIAAVVLSVLNIVIYFSKIKTFANGSMSLGSVFSFAIPVLLIFAIRGIWKDEKLIKSLDRLR